MAQDTESHAAAYGLKQNVADDYDDEDGPEFAAQTGRDRTRTDPPVMEDLHGPKTNAKIRQQINRQG